MDTNFPFSPFIDLLFPQLCVLCGESLLLSRAAAPWTNLPVCQGCLSRLKPLSGTRCRKCSLQLISEFEVCTRCRERDFPFTSHRSIFEYAGKVRELIGQYKFHGQRVLGEWLSAQLAGALSRYFPPTAVVPVPSRPRAVRKRGWDHVGELTDRLRRVYGVEVQSLLRRSNGTPQKSLDFSHRLTNLEGRIRWHPGAGGAVPKRMVLIDDVFTTGATASECSRILLEHGVAEVFVLTLAID